MLPMIQTVGIKSARTSLPALKLHNPDKVANGPMISNIPSINSKVGKLDRERAMMKHIT